MKKKSMKLAISNNLSFPDLPIDLRSLIMQHLSLKDNIRASAVSKAWHEAFVTVGIKDVTPWYMCIPIDKDGYDLYDPSCDKTYFCKVPGLSGSQIMYSRDGWLLMHSSSRTENFFFNPFTHERIEVFWPDMWLKDVIAFSCAPTSSSCVIFSIWNMSANLTILRTYSLANKQRTTCNKVSNQHGRFNHIVFSDGVFYCLSNRGFLGMYHISKDSWSLLTDQPLKQYCDNSRCFLTEYQGDIYFVYLTWSMELQYRKLDVVNQIWKEPITLSDFMIYFGFQCVVTTNRDLVCSSPWVNQLIEGYKAYVWIKPPINVSSLFKS